jgi:hypothetical protein
VDVFDFWIISWVSPFNDLRVLKLSVIHLRTNSAFVRNVCDELFIVHDELLFRFISWSEIEQRRQSAIEITDAAQES